MIKFFTNKELSQAFAINLAKWKRWSREFLPPDPLGGLQSGYARQYNLNEAFTVFFAGHLVGNLRYTIPESRQILHDLQQWLVDHDFYFDFSENSNPAPESVPPVQNYRIAIINRKASSGRIYGFSYRIRAIFSVEPLGVGNAQVRQERFQETVIDPTADMPGHLVAESCCILNISALRRNFLNCLQNIA
ncbi:MAG: hypothetical protein JSW26_28895 [Desulfobacterales bacterium]|nr:MAG: hypothetical protein JSW26_28895 [Desulfobacterales bacterium]